MSRIEEVYLALPIGLQHAVCSLEGLRIRHRRLGKSFRAHLAAAEVRSEWSEEKVADYRDGRLRTFVQHLADTVPYYARLFGEHGIVPAEIRSVADLHELPVLTKERVRRDELNLLSTGVRPRECSVVHTSGTTGSGFQFASTATAVAEQWAVWWRYRHWHGIQLDSWCGYFGGRLVVPLAQRRPPFWRYNVPGRQVLFSGYHMSTDTMASYVEELRRRRPPWLHGYPSLLALLAGYIVERGVDLGYQVGWITTGAENLLLQQARVIERAFGVRPRQHYGMAEGVANISECEQGSLHVDEDFAAVEFLPLPDGQGCRIVGTNFTNFATPLLRYEVGDIATPASLDAHCGCGRPGRIVAGIDGREEDYVILGNGARLGRLDHIFKDLLCVREAQIVQHTPGAITLRIVRVPWYSDEHEALVLREVGRRVGEATTVEVCYVDRLERSRTGKLRFVVSNVEAGKLGPIALAPSPRDSSSCVH